MEPAEAEQQKLEKTVDKENKDKFGHVKPVDGSEFVRDKQELKSRDGHVRLRKTLKGSGDQNFRFFITFLLFI